jgi:hypothetical protein
MSINREEFGPGVCVADFDGDGWQDIHFVNGRDLYDRGIVVGNALYHNHGDGTFTDVTDKAGVPGTGYGLGCVWGDYDNYGWPDIFVANDGLYAYLYHDQRDGTFEEMGLPAGMAVAGDGQIMAAMGISLGDYDNDGWLDLYLSDFQKSSDHRWHSSGKGFFEDVSGPAGVSVPTREVLSFGGGFFDYDNDGWLDLFIANGHVYPEVEQVTPEVHYKQLNTLFRNDGKGKFVETTKQTGSGLQKPYVGRGVAFADFDNDGFMENGGGQQWGSAAAAAQQRRERESLSQFKAGGGQEQPGCDGGAGAGGGRRDFADSRDCGRGELFVAQPSAGTFRTGHGGSGGDGRGAVAERAAPGVPEWGCR